MKRTVYRRQGDPYTYLCIRNTWYCYDPSSEPLGDGAMGTVYLGYRVDDSMLVAVKRVKDPYAEKPAIRARAKQEAALAFSHPNLIEMIGYCELAPDHGPIFLVSKYVRGENIDNFIDKLPYVSRTGKVCIAVIQVLKALEYLHSKGITHRDIKPANIMVEEGSNVRLMDLGIASINDGDTKTGFIGTPQYAAPEQILRGAYYASQINATTDIYSLGVTFYELLTRENPFDDESEAVALSAQLKEKLPPNSNIPDKLMKVIWKATEKNQSKRYQSATEFIAAIKNATKPEDSFWTSFKNRLLSKV